MKKKTRKNRYLTEMDELQRAVSKINIFENVLPVVHGKIVEDTETYNKIQELLDVPELEEAHQFLYDIDFDELNPETVKKVNGLYDLAVSKGLIEKPASAEEPGEGQPLTEDDEKPAEGDDDEEDEEEGEEGEEEEEDGGNLEDEAPKTWSDIDYPAELPNQITSPRRCFTCFYSAVKDGAVKTGEAYAMAEDAAGAKAEVIGNLSKLGMNEVNIIAVETGEETADAAVGEAEEQPPEGQEAAKQEADNAEGAAEDAAPAEETPAPPAEGEGEEGTEEGTGEEGEGEEEGTSDEEEGEELSNEQKAELVQKYVSVWKSVLKEMKYKSYSAIEVDKLGEFWNKIKKNWPEGKPDPRDFMTAKNIAELELKEIKLDNEEGKEDEEK